jgi:hypothetical protein
MDSCLIPARVAKTTCKLLKRINWFESARLDRTGLLASLLPELHQQQYML